MKVATGIIRRLIGADVPAAAARPLASIGVNFAALSVFTTFFGPWFIGAAGASTALASVTYVAAGLSGVVGGYLGGRLTDRYGPNRVAAAGSLMQVGFVALLLLPIAGVAVGAVSLVAVTFLQPVRGVAQRIALARTGSGDELEARFAGYRLVINLGAFGGPLLAAGFVTTGWWAVHAEIAVLFLGSAILVRGWSGPLRSAQRPVGPGTDGSGRSIWRDARAYGLVAATTAAWTIAYTYESVLPIVLTQSYGYSPATWGLIYPIGPVLILLFQLRVVRWLGGHSFVARLTAGTLMMGAAFLLLVASRSLWSVLLLICVFLVGDMVWGPASESAPLRIAPPAQQGRYVGVLTSSIWLGSAFAPGIGLPVNSRYGDTALWILVFAIGAGAAVLYWTTTGSARTRPEVVSSP